jgi:hypothetical protein
MRVLTISVFPSHGGQAPPPRTDGPGGRISRRVRRPPGELASNRCPRSSRIRPANDRGTSRNDGNGWSIESAGQEPDSAIAAGSEIGPEDTLKVETRVRTRWDYKREPHGAVAADALNGDSNPGYPANIPHEVVRNQCAKVARGSRVDTPRATDNWC